MFHADSSLLGSVGLIVESVNLWRIWENFLICMDVP